MVQERDDGFNADLLEVLAFTVGLEVCSRAVRLENDEFLWIFDASEVFIAEIPVLLPAGFGKAPQVGQYIVFGAGGSFVGCHHLKSSVGYV